MPAGSSHGTSIPAPIAKRSVQRTRGRLNLLHASGSSSCSRVTKGQLAADTLKDAIRILERQVFPALGIRPISDIRAHELLMVLKQIELKGMRETARRAK
jgi:hypothetical protein